VSSLPIAASLNQSVGAIDSILTTQASSAHWAFCPQLSEIQAPLRRDLADDEPLKISAIDEGRPCDAAESYYEYTTVEPTGDLESYPHPVR
jgi:hypothetical protein